MKRELAVVDVVAIEDVAADDETSFEEALRELEEVVALLEGGNVPLEQSITLLRRGMGLAGRCDATLREAEAALEELVATQDGELVARRLDDDDEE